ncbi:MAG: hypothetical protein V1829_02420 [bacterium]
MPIIKIEGPQKFTDKQKKLLDFINNHNPILILKGLSGRKLKKNIIFQHKSLKMEARFKDNIIYADFNNQVKYLWLCLCHELAHIILENPPWHKDRNISKIIKKQKGNISKYRYTFIQAIEQTIAILLQAACENEVGIRKLNWSEWEMTFDFMGVKNFGQKLWEDWLSYLNNVPGYKNIDRWILEELEKYWDRTSIRS